MSFKNAYATAALIGLAAAAPAPQGHYGHKEAEYSWSAVPYGSGSTAVPPGTVAESVTEATSAAAASATIATASVSVDYEYQENTGYTGADAPYSTYAPTYTDLASTFGPDSTVAYGPVTTPSEYPQVSSLPTGKTSHGPYSGSATTVGAEATSTLAASIATLPPNPTATYYNANGKLTQDQPAPYVPAGGLGTNGSLPRYMVESDFDFESIALGLYQEYIELDSFNNIVAIFSEEEFAAAGLGPEDISMMQFMAQQEQGHASLLTNMLGEAAPVQCTYNFPYTTVREAVDFLQILTRWGESGVWGFINHLDSREVGQLLAQSIATEARQEMIFRQWSGLHPMPVWFEAGIPQSWAWSFLAPYISSCPENNTRLAWQNFPALHVVNQANINRFSPNDTADWERVGNRTSDPAISTIPQDEQCLPLNKTGIDCAPAVASNRSEPLSFPGKQIRFVWDEPGQTVGPNNSYTTATFAGEPKYVGWVAQLNLTYTPLTVTGPNEGYTYQPFGEVYENGAPIVNGTAFAFLSDSDMFLTPFNLSMINPHVRALGVFQAG